MSDRIDAERRIAGLEEAVREARTELTRLRRLVLALVDVAPAEEAGRIGIGVLPSGSTGPATGLFTGWVESVQLTPSDVATELRLLWQRCDRAS